MFDKSIVSSVIVYGDQNSIYDDLQKILENMKFKVISENRPDSLELTRGSSGIMKTKIQDCKTSLIISLKEASENEEVDMLFDYEFEVPGRFTDNDKAFIQGEISRIHHELFDSTPSRSVPKFYREFTKDHKI